MPRGQQEQEDGMVVSEATLLIKNAVKKKKSPFFSGINMSEVCKWLVVSPSRHGTWRKHPEEKRRKKEGRKKNSSEPVNLSAHVPSPELGKS